MKDVGANVLSSIIHFIYHGSVDVPQDILNEFLSTAQSLEVRGLAEDGKSVSIITDQNFSD